MARVSGLWALLLTIVVAGCSQTDSTRWHVDWSQLTRDSFGNPIAFPTIDSVQVAFFQRMTAADVQARLMDIGQIATAIYSVLVPAGAEDVDLYNARSSDGFNRPLPVFEQTDGLWAVVGSCGRCPTPLPVFFSILTPTP